MRSLLTRGATSADSRRAICRGVEMLNVRRNELVLPERAFASAVDANVASTLERIAPESHAMVFAYLAVAARRPPNPSAQFDALWDEAWPWQRTELFRRKRELDARRIATARARSAERLRGSGVTGAGAGAGSGGAAAGADRRPRVPRVTTSAARGTPEAGATSSTSMLPRVARQSPTA